MVHARVLEAYIHFALMYTIYHTFPVLPIKDMINDDSNQTTPYKLATGKKPSVSHLCVLFFRCVVRKATAHIGTKALNMCQQAKNGFRGIFVGIPGHQKGDLVYVPSSRNIILSYDVVFDESLSSELAYMSQPYSEAMVMRLDVTCTPCTTYSREKTVNKITSAQFEEGNILTKTSYDEESDDDN